MRENSEQTSRHSHLAVREQAEGAPACTQDLFGELVMDQTSVAKITTMRAHRRPPWRPAAQSTATARLTELAAYALEMWLSRQPYQARSANDPLNRALESLLSLDPADLDATAVKLEGELEDLRARLPGLRFSISVLQSSTETSGGSQ